MLGPSRLSARTSLSSKKRTDASDGGRAKNQGSPKGQNKQRRGGRAGTPEKALVKTEEWLDRGEQTK